MTEVGAEVGAKFGAEVGRGWFAVERGGRARLRCVAATLMFLAPMLPALMQACGVARAQTPAHEAAKKAAGLAAGSAAGSATGSATGSIAGRLTDLRSTPLGGATVTVRNDARGVLAQTVTTKNGSYRLTGLPEGLYTLEAMSPGRGVGRLERIYVAGGGYEAHVQAALGLAPGPGEVTADARAGKPTPTPTLTPAPTPQAVEEAARRPALAAMPGAAPMKAAAAPTAEPARLPVVALTADAVEQMPLAGHDSAGRAAVGIEAQSPPMTAELAREPYFNLRLAGHANAALPAAGAGGTPNAVTAAVEWGAPGAAALTSAAMGAATAASQSIVTALSTAAAGLTQDGAATQAEGTTLTGEQLQALPAAGRRWEDFVLDTPGATAADGRGDGLLLRGAGDVPPETSLDGTSTRLAFGGEGGSGPESSGAGLNGQGGREQNGMGQAWAAGRGSPVAEAAVLAVQTAAENAAVAASRAAGGQMNLETARGTERLHGQASLFDRQNSWGAQNPFTQWVKQTTPAGFDALPQFTAEPYTPPDHEEVWGWGAGSEWKREKLRWFGALESYHRNDPGVATVKHADEFFAQPSNDQMQVLAARLGLSSVNPVAEGLHDYAQMLTTLDGLLGPAPRWAAQWEGFGRLDWSALERHTFTLEATGAHWNAPGGGLTRVAETYGSNSFGSSAASETLLLGRWEAFVTPNLLVVTQGSTGRAIDTAHADKPSAFEQTFLAPNVWGQLPQMVVDSRYGFDIGNPSRFGMGSYPDEHVNQVQETVNWVRGNVLVKAGFGLSHNADAISLLRNETGTYHYTTAENFASDALVFASYGTAGELNPYDQHNCDQTGRAWRDSTGTLHGLGYLPCYSYYTQTLGPTNWNLSSNEWSSFAMAQWQPARFVVVSGGLRWEREQLPPPIAAVDNAELPLTERLPRLGNNWGPRVSVAVGARESRWPVLRLGYGMYFGRTENATVETALTQTGSLKGDLNFFMRPTDNLQAGGAPPFPYVLAGDPGSVVKPGAVEFAPAFHNAEVHQAIAGVEEALPGRVLVEASGMVSLGRRLPISADTNFDASVNPGEITYAVKDSTQAGPIKNATITVPFYASWPSAHAATGFAGRLNPDYQQVTQVMSRANSTYEAFVLRVSRSMRRGVSLRAHYTFAHAADWNPNESTTVAGSDVLDPADFRAEYGTSNLDVRHAAAIMTVIDAPWRLSGTRGRLANGWMVSAIGNFRSGLPYTMRTSGALAEEFEAGTGAAIVALGPGMNGSGGDNRVYGVGRNTFRYPAAWKADMRLGKKFDLGKMRQLELLVESFNLFNHQNVTELETTGYFIEPGDPSGGLPTLNFMTGLKANTTAFGQPLNVNATNFYRERQLQIGMRMRF